MTLLFVLRIRGKPDRTPDEEKALELLRLHKTWHATLVQDTPSIRGMLEKSLNSVVTYGEIRHEVLAQLLRKYGRLEGNKRLTEEYLKSIGYDSFETLASALIEGKVKLEEIPGLKPVFRLHPPSGGFRGTIKKNFKARGVTGYMGEEINNLLLKIL
ncbi:MAG: 50S ribosomal protein L30 [Infirmifilum sp.]